MDDDAVKITEVKTAYAADKQSKYAHLLNGKRLRYADKARALQWAKEEGSSIFQLLTTSLAEPGSKVMLKENMPDVNFNLSDGVKNSKEQDSLELEEAKKQGLASSTRKFGISDFFAIFLRGSA